jgi:chaperonin GroEL (HSP60 family)
MLQDIALLTGGKAITAALGIQLENIQISDLGQARKIIIDKNSTVVEGKSKSGQLFFGPEHCIYLNAQASPVQASRTHITTETHGTLSA